MPAAHFPFLTMFPLTEWSGSGWIKENGIFQIECMPHFEHDNAHFIGISPAASLSDHVFPLIRSCTDDQNVPQSLWSYITGSIMADSSLAQSFVEIFFRFFLSRHTPPFLPKHTFSTEWNHENGAVVPSAIVS